MQKSKRRNQPNITLQKKCYTSWNKADFFAKDTLLLHRNKSGKQYPVVYISLNKITPSVSKSSQRQKRWGVRTSLRDMNREIEGWRWWYCLQLSHLLLTLYFLMGLWQLSISLSLSAAAGAFCVSCAVCEDKTGFVQSVGF